MVKNPVTYFVDNIYWTHYFKCHYPPYFQRAQAMPPPICSKTYLKSEVEALDPSLVIALGKPLVKALFGTDLPGDDVIMEDQLYGRLCLCADFPENGGEERFLQIRKRIKKYVETINDEPVRPEWYIRNPLEGPFEMQALKSYWQSVVENIASLTGGADSVDYLFAMYEVLPKLLKYSFLSACDAFVEDLAMAVLEDRKVDFKAEMRRLRDYGFKYSERETCLRLLVSLTSGVAAEEVSLERFFGMGMVRELRQLHEIRNDIIHRGGRRQKPLDIDGIETEPNGTLRIPDNYCERVLELLDNVVARLQDEGLVLRRYRGIEYGSKKGLP